MAQQFQPRAQANVRQQVFRNIYLDQPPRERNGVSLPKGQPLEVARALGVLPPEALFVEELFLRLPQLRTRKFELWLHNNLSAIMPSPQLEIPGKGKCGICTSNILGHPTKAHAMEECPIPEEHRLLFVSVNTRSFCIECRGRSDRHRLCRGAQATGPCRKCEENGWLNLIHVPQLGFCGIENEDVRPIMRQSRIEYYTRVSEQSRITPYRVKMYNDQSLLPRDKPRDYDLLHGSPAYIDENGEIEPVQYEPDAEFVGLIPTHDTAKREEIDKIIGEATLDYYLIDRPEASYEIREQVRAYRAEVERAPRADDEQPAPAVPPPAAPAVLPPADMDASYFSFTDSSKAASRPDPAAIQIRALLAKIRALLYNVTAVNLNELTRLFISYTASFNQQQLAEAIHIFFEKAVNGSKYCSLYADILKNTMESIRNDTARSVFIGIIEHSVRKYFSSSKTAEARIYSVFIGHLYIRHLVSMDCLHTYCLRLLESVLRD